MKILNFEMPFFVPWFRKMGHQVLSIGFAGRGGGYDIVLDKSLYHRGLKDLLAEHGFTPDLVLWNDTGHTPAAFGFEALPAVTIGFAIDSFGNPWHIPFSAAFDAVLVAQKDFVPLFTDPSLPRPARWFPLFCNPVKDHDPNLERDIPVSFVGTIHPLQNPQRAKFFESFKAHHPIVVTQGDYPPVFTRSRIVVNQSTVGEINFRQFEAAGCGAAVLTEETEHGLHDLFTPGEDILPTYPRGDAAAAAAVCRDYLARPEELRAIAIAGRRKVRRDHTAAVRAREIIRLAGQLMLDGAPRWRLANQRLVRRFISTACSFIAGEVDTCLDAKYVQQFDLLARTYEERWNII